MTEILTALTSTSGIVAIILFALTIVCLAFAIKLMNPYLGFLTVILAIASVIVLLYASGVIAISVDWSAWNVGTVPLEPAETPAA